MSSEEPLEVLLVLCCLVTVIVFLCFSLGTVNLAAQAGLGRADDGPARLRQLVQDLERTASGVARRIEAKRTEMAGPAGGTGDLNDKLAGLQKSYEETLRRIQQVQAELARIGQSEQDYEALLRELENLRRRIDEQARILKSIPVAMDPAMEKDHQMLSDLLASLGTQIQTMRNRVAAETEEPGTFNPRKHMTGDSTLKNPVIVECLKGAVMLHPEGRQIAISELGKANPFLSLPGKHDGIYFVIRPDGFDAFRQAFKQASELAEKSKLKIMYEGVESNLKLKL